MLDEDHLDAASARVLFDLGMGCGRLCMQAFLQYPNLSEVVGVELSGSRASVGMEALERLYEQQQDSKRVYWQLEMSTRPPYSTLTATSKQQINQMKRKAEQVTAASHPPWQHQPTQCRQTARTLKALCTFLSCLIS